MNQLSRDVIDSSPDIQYRLDLFSARLEEGVMNGSISVGDRQRLLQAYTSRWDRRSTRGELWSLSASNMWHIVKHDHLICAEASLLGADAKDVRFVQLPSPSLGVPTKEWDLVGVPGLPLEIHPPSDLLVASQITNEER